MATLIKLENVWKIYPMGETPVEALKKINLKIEKGEYTAIVGPSGSGKSTLMHIVGILDTPTKGKVLLEGDDVSTLSPEEQAAHRNRHIGFVFQFFNLLPRTTALDNVILPLLYAGVKPQEREKKAIEALEKVGLGKRLDHTPAQLSGGQQQRVAIARALVNNPSIILADEPTGNLDSKTGQEIMNLLENLYKQGNTIVLVTHELDLTESTERVIEIKDGMIVNERINHKK